MTVPAYSRVLKWPKKPTIYIDSRLSQALNHFTETVF